MAVTFLITASFAILFALTFVAWRRYLWAAEKVPSEADTCPCSLTDVFGDSHLVNVPHQKGVQWLTEVFSRSAKKFPHLTALQIPNTGESLTCSKSRPTFQARGSGSTWTAYAEGPRMVLTSADWSP